MKLTQLSPQHMWKRHLANQESRRNMKEWESRQAFRVKVVVAPRSPKSDLIWGGVICATWVPTFFSPGVALPTRIGIICLIFFLAVTLIAHHRDAKAALALGELVTKLSRQAGEKGLPVLDQIMEGDETIVDGVRSKPSSSGHWRTIAWLEADTIDLLTRSKDAPQDAQ